MHTARTVEEERGSVRIMSVASELERSHFHQRGSTSGIPMTEAGL